MPRLFDKHRRRIRPPSTPEADPRIREVERELGVSYPTVRARLDEVIQALGYSSKAPVDDETANDGSARRRIVLAELKAGKLTPGEALAALNERASKD